MNQVGLVLVGHGSKLPHSKDTLEKLAKIVQGMQKFKIVEVSFMMRNKPSLQEAIKNVIDKGAKKVVVIPVFLTRGKHTEDDIPFILNSNLETDKFPSKEIEIIYGEPLGPDKRIAEIIEDKALEALDKKYTSPQKMNSKHEINGSNIAGLKIMSSSLKTIRQSIPDVLESVPKLHVPIIERVVHATANPEFARLLVFNGNAIEEGVNNIKAGSDIITDVKMVKVGINEAKLRRFGGKVITYIDNDRSINLASRMSITRATAAMRILLEEASDGCMIVIGNSPTAVFEVVNAVKRKSINPALIIATPVGFIGAERSKEEILNLPVPSIIVRGPKGGSAVAVAITNTLLSIAEDSPPLKNMEV
ncbi:MAG: precorrin-8X methylmutase [Candidatus Methylarchaceae archaeon HK02M2]|nr:precorrin-8X methylmutase [Candidatus Methylarchaceae archaeon HK02M2]